MATRTAGLAEVRATLSWGGPEDAPGQRLLPEFPGRARCDLAEIPLPGGAAREICGTVRAFTEEDLGAAIEQVLRGIAASAALWDAVLETRVLRVARPRATPPDVLEALALDLWAAGFSVGFGFSWTPVPAGTVALGTGVDKDGWRDFFADHPTWNTDPRDRV